MHVDRLGLRLRALECVNESCAAAHRFSEPVIRSDVSADERDSTVPGSVVHLLVTALQIYSFIVLARVLVSWFPQADRSNPLVDALYAITDPVLEPVRRVIPPLGMVDISPIVVFFGLQILQRVLLGLAVGP